jgi:hypothetical protein
MPRGDGTGPMGQGPTTGWGRGPCGAGLRRGRGGWFGRAFFGRRWTKTDEKATLDNEEKILEKELAAVRERKAALKNLGK